jgi:hypothetical protein
MAFHIPETGIEVIEGLPGSGKSYYLVRRMLDLIQTTGRPVFTNLPLKWASCRYFLKQKGGERLANLLYELNEEHFRRFMARQLERARHNEAHKSFRSDLKKKQRREEVDRLWYENAGPDITKGEDANWIPGGAIIIIDELQNWFLQERQKDDAETLIPYLTKHRHHMHLILVASQDRMQIALPFRRNCSKFWLVRNKGEDKLAWGIRFKHFGIRAIGYTAFTGDQVSARSIDNATPIANYVVLTTLPWNSVYFKLYEPWTHLGSAAQLRGELQRARREAGVSWIEPGSEPAASKLPDKPEGIVRKATRNAVSWVLRFVGRWVRRLALVAIGSIITASILTAINRGKNDETSTAEGSTTTKQPAAPPAITWGKWYGLGDDWVRVDRQRLQVGDRHPSGATLLAVSRSPRACMFDAAGVLYLWQWGEGSPRRLGERDKVGAALHAIRVRNLEQGSE